MVFGGKFDLVQQIKRQRKKKYERVLVPLYMKHCTNYSVFVIIVCTGASSEKSVHT